eukprot:scaffold8013_cov124-Isochrysis_galbana.AAC.13
MGAPPDKGGYRGKRADPVARACVATELHLRVMLASPDGRWVRWQLRVVASCGGRGPGMYDAPTAPPKPGQTERRAVGFVVAVRGGGERKGAPPFFFPRRTFRTPGASQPSCACACGVGGMLRTRTIPIRTRRTSQHASSRVSQPSHARVHSAAQLSI